MKIYFELWVKGDFGKKKREKKRKIEKKHLNVCVFFMPMFFCHSNKMRTVLILRQAKQHFSLIIDLFSKQFFFLCQRLTSNKQEGILCNLMTFFVYAKKNKNLFFFSFIYHFGVISTIWIHFDGQMWYIYLFYFLQSFTKLLGIKYSLRFEIMVHKICKKKCVAYKWMGTSYAFNIRCCWIVRIFTLHE